MNLSGDVVYICNLICTLEVIAAVVQVDFQGLTLEIPADVVHGMHTLTSDPETIPLCDLMEASCSEHHGKLADLHTIMLEDF